VLLLAASLACWTTSSEALAAPPSGAPVDDTTTAPRTNGTGSVPAPRVPVADPNQPPVETSKVGPVRVDPPTPEGGSTTDTSATDGDGATNGASANAGPYPRPPATDVSVQLQDDGTYRYVDPYGRFSAKITADGRIEFADRWRRPSRMRPDRGRCCSLRVPLATINPLVGVQFAGPLEWLMWANDNDPLVGAKNDVLEATRPLRIALVTAWTERIIEQHLGQLEEELGELWRQRKRSAQQRRELLFQRWDECDEWATALGPPATDPEGVAILTEEVVSNVDELRLDGAARARRIIERFIREHLPRGTQWGYDAAELTRLNARRTSQETFAPYTMGP
jgi:hypothetical protein